MYKVLADHDLSGARCVYQGTRGACQAWVLAAPPAPWTRYRIVPA